MIGSISSLNIKLPELNNVITMQNPVKADNDSLFSFLGTDTTQEIDFDDDSAPQAAQYVAAKYSDFNRTAGNGLVDNDARQGEIGDCGLLSIIRGLRNSESGQEALSEIMSYDAETGVWSFRFNTKDFAPDEQGNLPDPITVTQAEVDKAIENKHVSKGDDDVSAIELAVEKYLTTVGVDNTQDKTLKSIVKSQNNARANRIAAGSEDRGYLDGISPFLTYIFTGKVPELSRLYGDSQEFSAPEDILDSFNKDTDILIFSQISTTASSVGGKGDETSNPFITIGDDQALANHAYTVCDVDGDNVILRESNNPSDTIVVTRDELLNCTGKNSFYYYSFPQPEAETAEQNPVLTLYQDDNK